MYFYDDSLECWYCSHINRQLTTFCVFEIENSIIFQKTSFRPADPYIFDRSRDPYIFIGPWIPLFLAVRESLYFKRSMDPYILVGPWIPIFWPVHGSLYFERSLIPLFRAVRGPLYFWPVRGSLYSGRSMDPYFSDRSMVPIFLVVHGSLYLKINYEIRPVKIKNLFYLAELFFFGREK